MRITNKMLATNFLSDMASNLQNMKTLQLQLTSGKEFRKPSDNPFAVARAMQMHSQIDTNKQYNSNIKDTINWLDTTDTALGQVGNVFQSIREKLLSAGNAAYGSDERKKIKDEINQRISQISQILNTSFDGEYIFGGTRGTTKPVDTEKDAAGNISLRYNSKTSEKLITDPVQSDVVTALDTNWSGKKITFNVDGVTTPPEITLGTLKADDKIDVLINDINNQIAKNSDLSGKIVAQATEDGRVSFKALSDSSGKDYNVKISSTDIAELSSQKDKQIPSIQFDMIKSKRQIEISQGVTVDYNVTASDIISFKGKDIKGQDKNYDIRELLDNIVKHLDSKDSADNNALTNDDLHDVDQVMSNILKVRSEVGAKENRMDSAKEQNEQSNLDMTDILSKTEDIDITEKTMEFATMQTVYLASLQTSAKVLQPTLMDYMR